MSGIYIHIPFCKQACHYCNFHFSTSLKLMDEMVDAITREIELRKNYLPEQKITSVYFGGGTPSLLSENHFKKIFTKLTSIYKLDQNAEITLEANPDDLTTDKLEMLREIGINRLSIGIQSFFDNDLKWMNRSHNSFQAHKVIGDALSAGFNNLSIDLIFGGLNASEETWQQNLKMAVDYGVHHLSCYGLTIEERTALAHQLKTGKTTVASEALQSRFYEMADDYLSEAGYLHYEISNYGLPGMLAVHNTSYWQQKPYIGLGPSAHSFNGHSRQWNISHNPKYIKAISENIIPHTVEELSDSDVFNEYLLTGLRTMWGCSWSKLNDLNKSASQTLKIEIQELIEKGWVSSNQEHFKLTAEGQLMADSIIASLFI